MGAALAAGWRTSGLAEAHVVVVDPDPERRAEAVAAGCTAVAGPHEVTAAPAIDAVVLAVKPQVMADVLPSCRAFATGRCVFLSIAAGRTLGFLDSYLGGAAPVVRAMPNTPAAVGAGISVACANSHVDEPQRALCHRLLAAVGEVAWVDDEALLDAVTAVSGSGPAYVFLLTEALAAAGAEAGLPAALSARLARATVIGAATLLARSGDAPDELRRAVTSPGGTTEAALRVLTGAGGIAECVRDAVAAAAARSRELAG
jgi:pyrroline-5-carboxylate reductase